MTTQEDSIHSVASDAVRAVVGGADPRLWQVEATAHILSMISPNVAHSDPGINMMVHT